DPGIRLAVLRQMRREHVPVRAETLTQWLRAERGEEAVGVILDALRDAPTARTSTALVAVVREKGYGTANRLRALALFVGGAVAEDAGGLADLAGGLEHGPVLAEILRHMGQGPRRGEPAALAALPSFATSEVPEVRAAAVEALGELRALE